MVQSNTPSLRLTLCTRAAFATSQTALENKRNAGLLAMATRVIVFWEAALARKRLGFLPDDLNFQLSPAPSMKNLLFQLLTFTSFFTTPPKDSPRRAVN